MAKIRVGGLGRLLLIVVAVALALPALALALPALAEGAYGRSPAATPATNSATQGGSPGTALRASDTSEHPEYGVDRCRLRHGRRSVATVSAPTPRGTTVSAAGPVRTGDGLSATVALTGRQAVPLSRSGELPVLHLVFRC
ncbi:hypothetical protein [Streptomyces sp. NPDC054765]